MRRRKGVVVVQEEGVAFPAAPAGDARAEPLELLARGPFGDGDGRRVRRGGQRAQRFGVTQRTDGRRRAGVQRPPRRVHRRAGGAQRFDSRRPTHHEATAAIAPTISA